MWPVPHCLQCSVETTCCPKHCCVYVY